MGDSAPSVKGQALRHLARREYSRAELERKLAPRVQDGPEASATEKIAAALDELAAKGLLSDQRAADAVLHAAQRRFGARRVEQVLQARGVAPDLVDAAVRSARASEPERALDVWRRRFGAAPADAAERARQTRFMIARGFDPELVRRLLRSASDD